MFALTNKGEKTIIRRKGLHHSMSYSKKESSISPELAAEIEEARRESRNGETIVCKTKEELDKFFDSL
jgi:hypothetical protein